MGAARGLGGDSTSQNNNLWSTIVTGSSKYLTNMYGKSQEIHDITKSKTRAKDIKKLLRSQYINDSNTNLNHREWKSNDNYFGGLIRNQRDESDVNSLINSGLYLTRTYKEGRDNLLITIQRVIYIRIIIYIIQVVLMFFHLILIKKVLIQNKIGNIHLIVYIISNQTEYTTTDGVLSINAPSKGRGLLNYNDKFGTVIKCISVNDEFSRYRTLC